MNCKLEILHHLECILYPFGSTHCRMISRIRWGPPGGTVGKNLPANIGGARDRVGSLSWKIPCSRKWQPTPEILPGKFHGPKSLAGYHHKELDTTEHAHMY